MMETTIDARGLSCPEPVILTKKAVQSGQKKYTVLVDAPAPRENVTRFLEHAGFTVTIQEDADGSYRLTAEKLK